MITELELDIAALETKYALKSELLEIYYSTLEMYTKQMAVNE